MTTLQSLLVAADPVRHEDGPSGDRRARLRHAIITAAARVEAPPGVALHSAPAAILVSLIVIIFIGAMVGFFWSGDGGVAQAAVRFEVHLAEDHAASGLRSARVGGSDRIIYLHPEIVVANGDIARSTVIQGSTPSQFWIDVRLNAAGAEKMRQATMNHLGRPIAILIDGEVVMVPTVKSPIGAAATISGDFSRADAQRIADGMAVASP